MICILRRAVQHTNFRNLFSCLRVQVVSCEIRGTPPPLLPYIPTYFVVRMNESGHDHM